MSFDSIPQRLFTQAQTRPEAPAHFFREGGRWKMASYREVAADVRRAGKALMALGLGPGSTVCILGFNRPEWILLDVAAMCIGGAPAGIYTTCSSEEVQYIIHHAESKLVLVENAHQLDKIKKEWSRLPHLQHVVMMRGGPSDSDARIMSWDDFMQKGSRISDAAFQERLDALEPSGLATLIYTSGTTGPPKGVMLSHQNLSWTADLSQRLNKIGPQDCTLSYLPLSHIAEQMFSIHVPITTGASIYFAESIERVPDNLKEVQPTLFFGVPRIWEKFHAGISAKLAQAPKLRRLIADQAMKIGIEYNAFKTRGEQPGSLLDFKYRMADKLVFSKVKTAVGLGRARICVSGAAPISKEIIEFFAGLDVVVYEVYGQSEGTGPTTFNQEGRTQFGSVGPPIPGAEVKIAEDGEILLKGPNVFLGYFKEPQATAETLIDGWLHSGDLGKFDEDGFLHITGRKKDIIITSGGKNIAPKNIEAALKNHPLISEAVVIGDRRKYLTALITLDNDAAKKLAQDHGSDGTPLHDVPIVRTEIQKAVDEVNSHVARVESIKKFAILSRNFSIEHGELTPTLKVKRRRVHENFTQEIDALYTE